MWVRVKRQLTSVLKSISGNLMLLKGSCETRPGEVEWPADSAFFLPSLRQKGFDLCSGLLICVDMRLFRAAFCVVRLLLSAGRGA